MAELKQTKGSIRVEGKVVGLDNDNTFREGVTKNGEGQPYRSASLTVKTSPNNVIYNLDTFGQVPAKKVKIFSNKNGEKKNMEIDFKDRDNMPEGFTCFGFGTIGTGFDKDASGKIKMKNYFNYDGAEAIKNNLHNDASVWIEGEFNINTYVSNGEEKSNVKYQVNRIGFLKDEIDFDAENFKQVASFEQEFVVISTQIDKEAKKLYVTGRIINFDKSWKDTTFVIDASAYETLAGNVAKKVKFGDLIKVQGKIVNGTVLVEVEETPEINWGGEAPEGQGKKANRNKISELQITNVVSHTAKVYKEDDFIVEEDPFIKESDNIDPFAADDKDNPFN